MENTNSNFSPNMEYLTLGPGSIKLYSKAVYWARILAIFFSGIGLLSVTYAFTLSFGSKTAIGLWEIVILLLQLLTYGFFVYCLWNFAKTGKEAIDMSDNFALGESIRYLTMIFRFIGIFVMFSLVVVIIGILFTVSVGGLTKLF
jgi:hypothetical protein